MKHILCEQGGTEWFEYHRGRATASNFDRIITAAKGKLSAGADGFIAELIAQLGTEDSIVPEGYTSRWMQHGINMEPEARNLYSLLRDVDVEQCGICLTDDGRFGASPDALVTKHRGGVELKCPMPKTHVSWLMHGGLPLEHKVQVHGELWVTDLDWIDFVSHCRGWELFVVRVVPDDFTAQLGAALDQFWDRYAEAVEKLLPGRSIVLPGCTEPIRRRPSGEAVKCPGCGQKVYDNGGECPTCKVMSIEAQIEGALK